MGFEDDIVRALGQIGVDLVVVCEFDVCQEGFRVESLLFADDIEARAEFIGHGFSVDGDCQHTDSLATAALDCRFSVAGGASGAGNCSNVGVLEFGSSISAFQSEPERGTS